VVVLPTHAVPRHRCTRLPRLSTMATRVTFEKSRIIQFGSLSSKEKERYMDFLIDNNIQVRVGCLLVAVVVAVLCVCVCVCWMCLLLCCVARFPGCACVLDVCAVSTANVVRSTVACVPCICHPLMHQFFKEKDGSFAANIRLCTAAVADAHAHDDGAAASTTSSRGRRRGSNGSRRRGSRASQRSAGQRSGGQRSSALRATPSASATPATTFNYSTYHKFWCVRGVLCVVMCPPCCDVFSCSCRVVWVVLVTDGWLILCGLLQLSDFSTRHTPPQNKECRMAHAMGGGVVRRTVRT